MYSDLQVLGPKKKQKTNAEGQFEVVARTIICSVLFLLQKGVTL